MNSDALRQAFLDYFSKKGHHIGNSSSLVPIDDPSLLFTNAGMVQFKDVFLGKQSVDYMCASTSQRCVRAGGKHNDLENVGYTARHHTFFEMLGNFSFGDYFKKEAITYAWDFLTNEMKLPAEKLWVTVYDKDEESANIWLNDIGVDKNKFSRIGAKDNFWSMGDVGPCGPCSEIFYDHGENVPGGPPGSADEDGDRYVEIWNLVFMQYNRDKSGELTPLPKPSVDTGMGLERLAAVKQNVHSNYDIDIFKQLIARAAKITECADLQNNSLKVIADHCRSCAFLVVDGVLPSNEGRGYVLRRIIRRAIRHAYQLGQKKPFFYKMVETLNELMGEAYPELTSAKQQVEKVLLQEEERFAETLEQGMKILEHELATVKSNKINGEIAFKLYDTYGFPLDLTADIARERSLNVDVDGFNRSMDEQRNRARAASQFEDQQLNDIQCDQATDFVGYDSLNDQGDILALMSEGEPKTVLTEGQMGVVVLSKSPFYAESGGQAGDKGRLFNDQAEFKVSDTQKQGEGVFVHIGQVVKGQLTFGDQLTAEVIAESRQQTAIHHSATHLLHAALRQILGDHVTQKGSLVDEQKLRFDFSHFEPIQQQQLDSIEQQVNAQIMMNNSVDTTIAAIDDAKKMGAMALFGEKYGDKVRVLSMGNFSIELCGGTHVKRTGDIGLFKIVSETGVASGVRRVEAVAGQLAINVVNQKEKTLSILANLLKTNQENITDKVQQAIEKNKQLEKQLSTLQSKMASSTGSDLSSKAVDYNGCYILAEHIEGADVKTLRDLMDQLKNKLKSAIIVLATVKDDKVVLIAGVTKNMIKQVKAGALVNMVATQVGGKGGGKPEMAQAGGKDPKNLENALKSVEVWVKAELSSSSA
ncbi:MAG: alanine--tRNA ligase [Methylococcales bacterium]|nr:alanine--tRNA ligase [Methylococcales bacterium]